MGANLTEPVRIGIVGAGNRGRNHAARYETIPGTEVVAVADVDEPKAQALAERYGAESYPAHAAMLAESDLDAVNVCVHATLHADIAVDALEAGAAVFCEKPMADDYAAARRMADAADRTGNALAVQNQLLYTKETLAAKSLADAGALGEVYHGTAARSPGLAFSGEGHPEAVPLGARRRGTPYVDGYGSPAFLDESAAGGGVVLDLGSYTVGQLLYLMGSAKRSAGDTAGDASPADRSSALEIPEVERVRAETFRTVPDRFERTADADRGEQASEYRRRIDETGYDVEDVAVAFVTLADGSVLSVRTSWSRYMEGESSALVGTRGGVRLDPFEYYATVGDVEMRASADLEEYLFRRQYLRGERGEAAYDAGLWADPLYHWVADLLGHREAPPTADLALESMAVTDGIYRSADLGREVTREEIVAPGDAED
ncbi:Gfo/Idh/MocA family oxidoreductase [Halorussus gelatinilyticus]|uniref:Gfo/Idh/MocA family oxidoreductase n=1 Tax=Halorussus gelatinilyticus TaxID=2937524 RepID=A0A8U0IM39_9EURY|nr:Gfo/Idh/MocA family oxidoreductase [Halorussus gelatinilyticus]UPW01442.1 Gfo/Idh/MocA family oxidoreductase [Halorussus gelatinilyticus]